MKNKTNNYSISKKYKQNKIYKIIVSLYILNKSFIKMEFSIL